MIAVLVLFIVSCFAGYGMYTRSRDDGGDYVVAKVNGHNIMRSELETQVRNLLQQYGVRDMTSRDLPMWRGMALEGLTVSRALQDAVKKKGIKVPDDEITVAYTNIMDQFPTREAFAQYIEQQGLKEVDIKRDIGTQLAQQKLLQDIAEAVSADEKEVKEFYDQVKDRAFNRPDGYELNLAVFKSPEKAKEARGLVAANKKESWDGMLTKFTSADMRNATSYDRPLFVSQAEVEKDAVAIKTTPLGSVSPVVKVTSDDFMIALKRKVVKSGILPWDEVSSDAKMMFLNQKRQQAQQKYVIGLKTSADVKIEDKALFEIPKEPEPASGDKAASGDAAGKTASGDKKTN